MKMSPVPQVAIYVVTQEKRGSERRRWLGFGWHGAAVLLVRSGTACRAPTEETAKAKRTMSGCEPSIESVVRRYVGTGRNACATERRTSKRNAACYDFGLVARCLLATVVRDFVAHVAQPVRMLANPSDGP
jgi:hypothetical protein